MKHGMIGATFAALLWLTPHAMAQDAADNMPPPDLSFEITEKDSEEFHKYFYFHKEGVSYETAFEEISECNIYQKGPIGSEGDFIVIMPTFVSLGENQTYVPWVPNEAGLVGVIMSDIFSGPLVLKNRGQRMRKCMEYKGYDRYGLSKDLWKTVNKISPDEYVKVHAKIASGPKPTNEKILP